MNEKEKNPFVISQENWSLHRKGHQDQQRHTEKVKEAIRNNLPDLISDESIIMSNGRDVIKIPIRSLDEYKIRYNYDSSMLAKVKETVRLVMLLLRGLGKERPQELVSKLETRQGKITMRQRFPWKRLKMLFLVTWSYLV